MNEDQMREKDFEMKWSQARGNGQIQQADNKIWKKMIQRERERERLYCIDICR
ncbi:hypothetical protein HanIR_Chr01g0035281 [Helianthus annuus]|nr:hypothetical protein HanIR_Chr01g0035281 [Helianthus annuus]